MYGYDAASCLVGVTDPAGETARYWYDAAGNRLGVAGNLSRIPAAGPCREFAPTKLVVTSWCAVCAPHGGLERRRGDGARTECL